MPDTPHLRFEVVIAGGGFAGVYAAKALAKELGREGREKVALIADENFMVFQPMLAEVVGSSLSPRHVINPLRRLCRGVTTLRGRIESIDLAARCLTLDAGDYTPDISVEFGHLAMAPGSIVDLSRVPGMPEHAYVLKNVGDALEYRSAIIDRFEEANFQSDPATVRRLLTFVVVGGGYSGVETAGQVHDLIIGINRLYPRIAQEDYRVVLVHSREHLMPEVSESLAIYCEKTMRARGLELLLGCRVQAMTASKVILDNGESIDTHTVLSTVGNAAHPLIVSLCEQGVTNVRQRLTTDPQLRVTGADRLWAAGDCAAVPMVGGEHDDQRAEKTCPPTAQFALREGTTMGRNIARSLRGRELESFTFTGLGELATIGHRSAVAEIMGLKFHGVLAWFMWRTIYVAKLPGLERKVRVLIDWTFDLFFPRDIALLRPRPTQVLQQMHLEKGDKVFEAGDPALSLYIVKSGRIDLRDETGLVRSLGAGEHFGERALLYDRVWRFSAEATEPSELVALNEEVFASIATASPSLHKFFEQSAARFITREETESLLAAMPAEVRGKTVGDLMNREPVAMRGDQTLAQALALMVRHPYNSFPLVDEENRPLGVISQSDLYNALKSENITLQSRLSEITSSACATVNRDTSVPEAIERFYRSGRNKVLVLDENKALCGILTPIDLMTGPSQAAS